LRPRPYPRRRAAQRGSLIIETLVVTPLFATLCGFAFWFYQVHRAQMLVYQKVREPVWAAATFGCGDAGDTGAPMPGPEERISVSSGIPPVVPADYTLVIRNVPGGPNNDAITRLARTVNADATETLVGKDIPNIMSTPTSTFRTDARVICNEHVEDGKAKTMKRIAAVVFRP
jgi:hypothetical protein